MDHSVNSAIGCTVSSCAHHCKDREYCTLNAIKVDCCDPKVTGCASTECASFKMG